MNELCSKFFRGCHHRQRMGTGASRSRRNHCFCRRHDVLGIAAIGQREREGGAGLAPIECNKVAGKLLVIQSMGVINKNWIYHKFNFIFCDLPSTAKIFQFRSDCDYLCQFVEVDGRGCMGAECSC